MDWRREASCRNSDPSLFSSPDKIDIAKAKLVCAQCSVRIPCLEEGLSKYEFGVWGGTDESERRRMRKRRVQLGA